MKVEKLFVEPGRVEDSGPDPFEVRATTCLARPLSPPPGTPPPSAPALTSTIALTSTRQVSDAGTMLDYLRSVAK